MGELTIVVCHVVAAFGAMCFGYLIARYVGRIERRQCDVLVSAAERKVEQMKELHVLDLAHARNERTDERDRLVEHGNRLLDHGTLMLRWGDRFLNMSIPEPERAAAIADIKAAMVEASTGQRVVTAVLRRLDEC